MEPPEPAELPQALSDPSGFPRTLPEPLGMDLSVDGVQAAGRHNEIFVACCPLTQRGIVPPIMVIAKIVFRILFFCLPVICFAGLGSTLVTYFPGLLASLFVLNGTSHISLDHNPEKILQPNVHVVVFTQREF